MARAMKTPPRLSRYGLENVMEGLGVFSQMSSRQSFSQHRSAGNTCVEQTFADTVCYTLHYSDIFNSKTLGTIQRLKTLDAFRNFVLGVATANPVKLALNAKTLMQNVVVPAMYKVIGGISYLARIDPDRRFQLELKSQYKI